MLLATSTMATEYMDKETSEALGKVIEYIINSIGKTVEDKGGAVVEYIKELGTEIVAYKAGIAYMWLAIAAVLMVIAIIMFIVSLVKDREGLFWGAVAVGLTALIIGIINGYTLIACYTFPEKVILEFIKHYNETH